MKFLSNLIKINEKDFIVQFIHNMPLDKEHGIKHEDGTLMTVEELNKSGVLVDSIPDLKTIEKKVAVLHVNPNTKETWYEYEDIPLSPEEQKYEDLLLQVKQSQTAINTLLGI